ncbi:ion channel [Nitrospira sp. Ecomares 2.1]
MCTLTPGFEVRAYYSFVTYTTVGFGGRFPIGPLRFPTGIESQTKLVRLT